MSWLKHIISRWLRRFSAPQPEPISPDAMSLHEWADLPPHHPLCERTPC